MAKPIYAQALAAVFIVSLSIIFMSRTYSMSEDEYGFLEKNINSEYRAAKNRCLLLTVNLQTACIAIAKDKKITSKLELDKSYKNKVSSRSYSLNDKADADYFAALQICDRRTAEDKEFCKKIAKNIHDNEIDHIDARKGSTLPMPELLSSDKLGNSSATEAGKAFPIDLKKTLAM